MPYSLLEFEVRTVSPCEFPILRGKVDPRQMSQTRFPPLYQRRNGRAILGEWSANRKQSELPNRVGTASQLVINPHSIH
jgi:hypothetical protein